MWGVETGIHFLALNILPVTLFYNKTMANTYLLQVVSLNYVVVVVTPI